MKCLFAFDSAVARTDGRTIDAKATTWSIKVPCAQLARRTLVTAANHCNSMPIFQTHARTLCMLTAVQPTISPTRSTLNHCYHTSTTNPTNIALRSLAREEAVIVCADSEQQTANPTLPRCTEQPHNECGNRYAERQRQHSCPPTHNWNVSSPSGIPPPPNTERTRFGKTCRVFPSSLSKDLPFSAPSSLFTAGGHVLFVCVHDISQRQPCTNRDDVHSKRWVRSAKSHANLAQVVKSSWYL